MIKKITTVFATIILSGLLIWWLNIPFLSFNSPSPIVVTSTPFLKDIIHYLLDADVRIYSIHATNTQSKSILQFKLTKEQRNIINNATLIINDSQFLANAIEEGNLNKSSSSTIINLIDSKKGNQIQMEHLTDRKKLESAIYQIESALLNQFKANQTSISDRTSALINKLGQLDINVAKTLPKNPIGILCDQNFKPLLNAQAIQIITCEDIIKHPNSVKKLKKNPFKIPPIFISKLTNSKRLTTTISILRENSIYTTEPHTLVYDVKSDRRDNAYLLIETNMNQIINGFSYKN